MAIVSHTHKFIFLTTSKTASSSVEASLARYVGRRDWIRLTSDLGVFPHPFFRTSARTTTWMPREEGLKRLLERTRLFPGLLLQKHASAREVRDLVGLERWSSYTKIAVERNSWDRFISLWRWKTRNDGRTLDTFLDDVEKLVRDAPNNPARRQWWTTWPIYTVDDVVVVDHLVRYERLADDLHSAMASVGIDWDRWLPRFKSQYRNADDRSGMLTDEQIVRISRICASEITYNRFTPPRPSPVADRPAAVDGPS